MKLETEEQNKLKARRRIKIIDMRTEIGKTENRKITEKSIKPKGDLKKLSLLSEFSNITGYKVNIHKSVIFPLARELLETDIKNMISFIINPKK